MCVGLSYHQTEIKDAMYDHVIVNRPDMINILVAHGGDEKHIPIKERSLQCQVLTTWQWDIFISLK